MNDITTINLLAITLVLLGGVLGVIGAKHYYHQEFKKAELSYIMMAEDRLNKARYDYYITWVDKNSNKTPVVEYSEVADE